MQAREKIRRLTAQFVDTDAHECDLMMKRLFIEDDIKGKVEQDTVYARLGQLAIEYALTRCITETQKKYPDYNDLFTFLGAQPVYKSSEIEALAQNKVTQSVINA